MTTAYCFDSEHVYHRNDGHPENPNRLAAVMARLRDTGVLARLREIPPAPASLEAIARVHPEPYAAALEAFCVRGGGLLDTDTYATETSFGIARRAAGGLLALTDQVVERRVDNAFALTRPPGHHARPLAAMGFCLFANAAIAARHAQQVHGAERVLIVDFDVHHGNGTQEVFYEDPTVLTFSSHQDPCYPGTGAIAETGALAGEGFNVNVPFPPGTGDELIDLYRAVLPPLAARFAPDLVIVCAGFDAHHLDPLAHANLSASGFADLMRLLLEIADTHCGGRLVATLEGGYHAPSLAESVRACLAVMGDSAAAIDDVLGPVRQPGAALDALTAQLRALHGL